MFLPNDTTIAVIGLGGQGLSRLKEAHEFLHERHVGVLKLGGCLDDLIVLSEDNGTEVCRCAKAPS